MEHHLREQLADLARRLHLHRGSGEDEAQALHGDVQNALDHGHDDGLSERLADRAVAFENEHPDLADTLRRVADAISAAGM